MHQTPRTAEAQPGFRTPHRVAFGLALALALLAIVVVPSRPAAAEAPEPPGDAPVPPVPIVTLDALPLGVPLSRLDDQARGRAEAVLGASLFAHRITGLRARSREPIFVFLLDHLDFATAVARALRLGQYVAIPLEDGYWGDDRRGARGQIRVLHAEEGRRLFHLEGTYEGRGLPIIKGQILVLIEFQHAEEGAGGTQVEASLTAHVRLDTPLVGGLAQVAATLARPALERAAERKVRRFFSTVSRVSRWAADEPEKVWAALEGHPEVPQDGTLAAFREILLADRPPLWASEPFFLLPADATAGAPREPEATSP
jgi:hypothetical protein